MWLPDPFSLSFRGAAEGREPGIQKQTQMISSGFRLSRRSLSSGRASRGPVGRSAGMTGKLTRLLAALALAGLTAGCFQPLYGTQSPIGGKAGVGDKMSAVEVAPIAAPNGTRLSRIGVNVRNELMYQFTGGAAAATNYRLNVSLAPTSTSVIVDVTTGRPDIAISGIDASYTLTDITNGKLVVNSTTFSRVSYNIPGQQQRFAGERGLRDAEDRAAKVIAENIRSRLASYFAAGT